jgi:phosphate-selective porin OprO/OprP
MQLRSTLALLCALAILLAAGTASAQEDTEERPESIEERLDRHEEEIRRLREALAEQGQELEEALSSHEHELEVYYDNGVRFETADGKFEATMGGRIDIDWAWYFEDSGVKEEIGRFENRVQIRRARLHFLGAIYGNVEYKAEFELSDGDVGIQDVYLGLRNVPYLGGTLRIGNIRVPSGLELTTSGKHLTFMERAMPVVLSQGRGLGIYYGDVLRYGDEPHEVIHWSTGVFSDTDDLDDTSSSVMGSNVVVRGTTLPWYEEDGRKLLHLGLSAMLLRPGDSKGRFRTRPEANSADHFILDTATTLPDVEDTDDDGDLDAVEFTEFELSWARFYGLEAAIVLGPLSVQSEFVRYEASSSGKDDVRNRVLGGDDPTFWGTYAYVSYFITGEHRRYSRGRFVRTIPDTTFIWGTGSGAVEVALRYSHLDLESGRVEGGRASNWTLGANWYLNSQTSFMLNYIRSSISGAGDLGIFQFRFHIEF